MTSAIAPQSNRTEPVASSRPGEFDRLAVITIQGGGIYGLNSLGQRSYLMEELKVVPVAIAGDSAGSIVATFFHSLSGRTDGAVLGDLNLDASLPYDNLGIDPDTAKQWTDPRIETVLHLITAASAELGQRLSGRFARKPLPTGDQS